MRYISTRGGSPGLSFSDVLVGALAPDGGLFMPESWPVDAAVSPPDQDYTAAAFRVMRQFVGDCISGEDLAEDIKVAYMSFDPPGMAPLVELEPGLYLLELFHGPTLAFKDIAMQLLARLMSRELARRDAHATILVATSGDTGSAAIAAFGGLPRIEIFVLHPQGRVSEVQRRQMTTAPYVNVHNVALEGTFDDAQALVKTLFADRGFATAHSLIAVNSINFVRIVAQSVYYFTTAAKLGRPARFVVPTGNFGDIFAGEAAARMGVPVAGLIAATNANDILARALNEGVYAAREARATLSPSMDIQVASNFERALFEASNRDHRWLSESMEAFARERKLVIPSPVLAVLRARYAAEAVSDDETLRTIRNAHERYGRVIDPHTAVGLATAGRLSHNDDLPIVVLSTAHPAKFPETVAKATGTVPPLPPHLRQSYLGTERASVLPPEADRLRSFIETRTTPHER
ncbi:MAG TPA: threonine synthase [Rhizomicrobium sp.]|jgi:threonine synthase|nr:threonine synthase [Rhizomicrobium sp.]